METEVIAVFLRRPWSPQLTDEQVQGAIAKGAARPKKKQPPSEEIQALLCQAGGELDTDFFQN